jgi:hypothetical protein
MKGKLKKFGEKPIPMLPLAPQFLHEASVAEDLR